MTSLEETERALRDSGIHTTPALDDRILRAAGLALDAALSSSPVGSSNPAAWWTGAMRSTAFRVASVAVIVLGVFLGVELIKPPGTGRVVWAQVPARMAEVDRFMFRLTARLPDRARTGGSGESGSPVARQLTMAFFGSSTLGTRWDLYDAEELVSSVIYPPEMETGISINYEERSWSRVASSGDAPFAPGLFPILDPRAWVERFLERDGTEIGRSTIDGVEVEGLEVIDPPTQFGPGAEAGPRVEGTGRLWVGLEYGLPVRIEIQQGREDDGIAWTLDFRWGAQVDPVAFEPRVPEGYAFVR